MKKLGIVFILLLGFTFLNFRVLAAETTPTEEQPTLPQNESESKDKVATQQIESPQFYTEENSHSFIKGAGVGLAVGLILGGIIAFFFRKKLS